MLRIVWEYHVRPEKKQEFEDYYSSSGDWASLFRGSDAYIGTVLLQAVDDPLHFTTIDSWTDLASFRAFKSAHAEEYALRDRECEELMQSERLIGYFERSI
jgi:heme-degrading monooxygenase HmoA